MEENVILTKEYYNSEPISCCSDCLSLVSSEPIQIKKGNKVIELCYCPYCNNTDYIEMSIEEWESRVEKKYGENFLKSKKSWRQLMENQQRVLL